jgi:hypothetical protein
MRVGGGSTRRRGCVCVDCCGSGICVWAMAVGGAAPGGVVASVLVHISGFARARLQLIMHSTASGLRCSKIGSWGADCVIGGVIGGVIDGFARDMTSKFCYGLNNAVPYNFTYSISHNFTRRCPRNSTPIPVSEAGSYPATPSMPHR